MALCLLVLSFLDNERNPIAFDVDGEPGTDGKAGLFEPIAAQVDPRNFTPGRVGVGF